MNIASIFINVWTAGSYRGYQAFLPYEGRAVIIFQTAGGGDVTGLGLGRSLLEGRLPSATTFRSNGYIHRLNRTLQAEMRAVSAYGQISARAGRDDFGTKVKGNGEQHRAAGQALVRLIIANRGIPEDKTALSLGLTKTWIGLCNRIPSRIFARATLGTLLTLESRLVRRYRELLKEAPARDVPALRELLRGTERHRITLLSR